MILIDTLTTHDFRTHSGVFYHPIINNSLRSTGSAPFESLRSFGITNGNQ